HECAPSAAPDAETSGLGPARDAVHCVGPPPQGRLIYPQLLQCGADLAFVESRAAPDHLAVSVQQIVGGVDKHLISLADVVFAAPSHRDFQRETVLLEVMP